MLRFDGVYLHEAEDGEIIGLRFYPPQDTAHVPVPPFVSVMGMTTTPQRLESDLRWFGTDNANRFEIDCANAYVSVSGNTLGFVLTPEAGYSWSFGESRRFEGTIRPDSLDLETHRWTESFETCPHILCYFEFRPLPPDFEQTNAPADDPNTDVCVRCGVRAFKKRSLQMTAEGYRCRACGRKAT